MDDQGSVVITNNKIKIFIALPEMVMLPNWDLSKAVRIPAHKIDMTGWTIGPASCLCETRKPSSGKKI